MPEVGSRDLKLLASATINRVYVGVIIGIYWGYTGVILGLYWGYIGVILGLWKRKGNFYDTMLLLAGGQALSTQEL